MKCPKALRFFLPSVFPLCLSYQFPIGLVRTCDGRCLGPLYVSLCTAKRLVVFASVQILSTTVSLRTMFRFMDNISERYLDPDCQQHFCGTNCGGTCDDPDTCEWCWVDLCCPTRDHDFSVCAVQPCPCTCHEERDDTFTKTTNGSTGEVEFVPKRPLRLACDRPGIFDFLKLPAEVRNKIYT